MNGATLQVRALVNSSVIRIFGMCFAFTVTPACRYPENAASRGVPSMAFSTQAVAPLLAELPRLELLTSPVYSLFSALALVVGAMGIAVILWGTYSTLVRLISTESAALRSAGPRVELEPVRLQFASYLLLGLELTVAADVIKSLVAPDWQHVAILGGIVLIRTVISVGVNWEVGRNQVRKEQAVAAAAPVAAETPAGVDRPVAVPAQPAQ
jgi:uncharacterized membrane protein